MFRLYLASCMLACSLAVIAGPDPLRPPVPKKTVVSSKPVLQASKWRLSLIRQDGTTRSALINGKLVRVGSQVDGARVAAIGKQQAILQLPDRRSIKLQLPSLQLRRGSN